MSFLQKKQIVIDHTKVGTTDHTDFPMLFSGTYAYLADLGHGGNVIGPNGEDISFYADASLTTLLDYEQVSWDGTTGAVEYYVRIPHLSHVTDTTIYLAWSSFPAVDQSNKNGVWDANYSAVYHFQTDPSGVAPQLPDSTVNANDGTVSGTWVGGDLVDGLTGKAWRFATANGQFVTVPHSTSLDSWSSLTIEALFRANAGMTSHTRLVEKGGNSEWGLIWADFNTNHLGTQIGVSAVTPDSTNSLANGTTYHMITALMRATPHTSDLYVDGLIDVTNNPGLVSPSSLTGDLNIGQFGGGGGFNYDGLFEELRITKDLERSADWILAQNNSITSPATFYTLSDITTQINTVAGVSYADVTKVATIAKADIAKIEGVA